MGSDQLRAGRADCACGSWVWLIRSTKRPLGATRLAATGKIDSKRSTARRVTTAKDARARDSARAVRILTSVNVRARATSLRNVAFFWFDSIKVNEISGAQSLMGMPGNPAPEPTSASSKTFAPEGAEGKKRKKKGGA